jgi:glucose-6-phosphate isomerase
VSALTRSPAWRALAGHHEKISATTLSALFAADPERAQRFNIEAGPVFLDYSRHRVDAETLRLLVALAEQAQVREWTAKMFAGEPINATEGRAVLHVALRARDAAPEVRQTRERMRRFVEEARGEGRVTDVVNIGIGGSDLGPRMLTRALRSFRKSGPRAHFVSNIDPADLDATLADLAPQTTLFVVASKTFTTAETLANAGRARAWLEAGLGRSADLSRHFAAATANVAGAATLGVPPERVFPMWDWVGGRYSLWSAVGLPLALAIGMDAFEALLGGAADMDAHFRSAPLARNLPVLLALLEIWCVNFLGAQTRAVIPYSEDLRDLPAYLQQLEMESNGKRVDREGHEVDYATAPVVWGASGTNSQHSFHQLLHQGTRLVPVDFIIAREPDPSREQAALAANALAQASALAFGHATPGAPHKALPGNRPSSVLLLERIAPEALGALIAAYEHKVFVEGIVWNLNSFDQWGVEHGKTLARTLAPRLLQGGDGSDLDSSTRALLARLRARD